MLTIPFTEAQLRALIDHVDLTDPSPLTDGRRRAALHRAITRIRTTYDLARPDPLDEDLDHLADTLAHIRDRRAYDRLHARLRDLTATAALWRAAEQLPPAARAPLLRLDRIDALGWPADVLDALARAGLSVTLPREPDQGTVLCPS